MIDVIFFAIISLWLAGCFFMMIRNHRVFLLRESILDESRKMLDKKELDKASDILILHNKYSYERMFWDVRRSIRSYRKELFADIRRIQNE